MEIPQVVSTIGGVVAIVGTTTLWLRGGFKKSFDAEKAIADIASLKQRNIEFDKLVPRVSNLEQAILEMKRNYEGNNAAILMKLDDLNKNFVEMNRSLGRLEGKLGHE